MKFLIVMVSIFMDINEFKNVSVIAGPYDSLAICDQALTKGLAPKETLIRNNENNLIKLTPDGASFLQCIAYHPHW